MANATRRLHLLKYEEEPDWDEDLNSDEGPVLDDEQVERLLLGARSRTQRDRDREPVAVIAAANESDGLTAMRGAMIGLAWVAPFWGLVAAILVFG